MSGLPVGEAYAEALMAIAASVGRSPIPAGLTTVDVGDWTLTANNSSERLAKPDGQDVPPFHIVGANRRFVAVVVLAPSGGAIGGMPAADFIAEMKEVAAQIPKPAGGGGVTQ